MLLVGSGTRRAWAFLSCALAAGRPRQEDPLESGRRQDLVAFVAAEPGINVVELAKRASLPWGSVYYHLNLLLEAGFIRIEPDPQGGRRRRVFLVDEDPPAIEHPRLTGTTLAIASLVATSPGLDLREIVKKSDRSVRWVQEQLKKLVDEGLITSSSTTRYRGLQPTPALLEILGSAQPTRKTREKRTPP